jgi:2-aminobenzoate-CoA ligase
METAHIDRFVIDRLPPDDAMPEFRFETPYPERLNAAVELLDGNDPNQAAVIDERGTWSYARIADVSDRIAWLLVEEEGLVPGNRVLLRGPNGGWLFAAWLGVLKAGGVVVATMPILRGGEIATILKRAEVSHALVDHRCLEDYDKGAAEAGTVRSLVVYGDAAFDARVSAAKPGFAAVDTHRDDPALIAFTSGTTGVPKGCVHYHRDILACADSFCRHVVRPERGDVWLGSAPIAFTFGLGASVIFPMRFGGTAVTLESPNPKAVLDAVERHRVTTLFTAPTAYRAMLGMLDGRDIGALKTCVSAGEHLPEATWRRWHEATGIRIIDGIGATEMMHIFISASGDDIRPGATGKAVPGYEACVLDDEGNVVLDGTGRLAVKGPTGCRYFDDARQRIYVRDGWNVTGDTYRRDAEGYFWYLARSDDMIVSSGYNIAAPEVENALLTHPAVAECAVVGAPDEARGMIVKAVVVPADGHPGGDVLVKTLQDHVKATIAPYKYPRAIEFVAALPKTATGKLQRHALR